MQKVARIYTTIAVLFLNTLLCFVALNLAVAGYGLLKENTLQQPTPAVPGSSPLAIYDYSLYAVLDNLPAYRQVYYYLENEKDMLWLVLEHENRTQYCDDDTLFRVVPFKGRYLNIDPMGYRISSNNAPWPPDESAYNIFVFGGSTTFGTGVADDHTIPFYMQQQIQAVYPRQKLYVYNFANPAFVSSQERMRFESLIRDGYVPDAAIFIDGLNDFYYLNPSNNGCLPNPYDTSQKWRNTFTCQPDEICLPLQKFAYSQLEGEAENAETPDPPPLDDVETNTRIVEEWIENKGKIETLAEEKNISTLFVMQPVPGYAYDLQYHLWTKTLEGLGAWGRSHWGYPIWETKAETGSWSENFLNLAHMAEDFTWNIWVDPVHYTRGFNEQIAQKISDEVVARGWLEK